jgi:hypothetical protein
MGLGWTQINEFKMNSSCTIQERRWLVQIEIKMINENIMRNTHSHKHCSPNTHALFVKVKEKKIVPSKEEFA